MKGEKRKKSISELRRDLVSGDWIVIATGRARRPHAFAVPQKVERQPKRGCPFEDPQKAGNKDPVLVLAPDGLAKEKTKIPKNWFVQVVPNKFPAFGPGSARVRHAGPYEVMDGIGFHEIVITKDHDKTAAQFTAKEAELLIAAYRHRFQVLQNKPAVRYVSVFHNWGRASGASIYHPHSQIIAIPTVPPDVGRSIAGSERYFRERQRCVHCDMVAWERKIKKRVVYENQDFVAFCPFVSRTAFEVRIFPKRHEPDFAAITPREILNAGDALRMSLRKIHKGLKSPSYNFFIHTAPCNRGICPFYHWHLEIIPKTAIWAGFEIATGIEISTIDPADAAGYLRKF